MTVSRAHVTIYQGDTFSADKLLAFNGLHAQLEMGFFTMVES